MVALRGQYVGPNPVTGVNGIWWQKLNGSIVGMSKADLRPTANGGTIATGTGSAAQRKATYLTNATAALQAQLGPGFVLTITMPTDGTLDIDNVDIRDA